MVPTAEPGLVRCSESTSKVASVSGAELLADGHLREAEIENLRVPPLGHKDIRRLDVAMHDAFGVRDIHRVGNFDSQIESRPVSTGRPAIKCFTSVPRDTPSR